MTCGSSGRAGASGGDAAPNGKSCARCASQTRCDSAALSSGCGVLSTRHAHCASVAGSRTASAAAAMTAGPCGATVRRATAIDGNVLAQSMLLRHDSGCTGQQRHSTFTVKRAEIVIQSNRLIVLALVPLAVTAQNRDAVAYYVSSIFRKLQRGRVYRAQLFRDLAVCSNSVLSDPPNLKKAVDAHLDAGLAAPSPPPVRS